MQKNTDSLETLKKSFGFGAEESLSQYEEAETKMSQEEISGHTNRFSYEALKEKIEKRGIKSYSEQRKERKDED